MASASISGLSSGLDTATIIEQFMQLEALPQSKLKTRVSTEQTRVNSLQTVNAKLASLFTKTAELTAAGAWDSLQATSSNAAVSVTASNTASPTALSVKVTATALSHQLGFATAASLTDVVTGASTTVTLERPDGTVVDLDTGTGTLQDLVTTLNDPANATGVRASAVKVADGQYRLLVESTTTGLASDFSLTELGGGALLGGATARAGQDAVIDLGAGITATSATNTFTDVVPGVTLTVAAGTAAGTTADVSVARSASTRSAAVKSLVDTINGALGDISSLTAYNSTTKSAGLLAGDPTMRNVSSQLINGVYPADGSSLATYGIQVDRHGKLTFDAAAFEKAYTADPAAATAAITGTGGLADRIGKVAKAASDEHTGFLTEAIKGRNANIGRLNDSIEQWDLRLELRRTTLTRQFTALETALGQMNSQASWLAGQIGTLPTNSA